MASSSTPLGFNKQGTGDNTNTWGVVLNDEVIALIDEAIRGMVSMTLSGSYTLDATNYESNEARCMFLNITGGTGGTITLPAISKFYFVRNATTGDVILTVGGAAATIPGEAVLPVVSDGASVWTLRLADLPLKDYIDAAVLTATGTLPATTGNEGKALVVVGGAWVPTNVSATPAQVRAGTATNRFMSPGETYDGLEEVTLTSSGGSIALDMNTFINGYHDLTENTTLANPTNAKVGQTGWIRVRQHASSAKTCATGSNWYRVGGDLPVDTTLSSYNIYEYQVIAADFILYDILRNPTNI